MNWIIDPIESFSPNGSGLEKQLIIVNGSNDSSLDDEILWKAGKQAFDFLQEDVEEELTQADLDQFMDETPKLLVEIWNQFAQGLQPLIDSGGLGLIDSQTEQSISHLEPLDSDQTGLSAWFTLEQSIYTLDDLFEELCLRSGEERFPFDRRLIAAYFTLLHLDVSAADIALKDPTPDTYFWVKRWPEKLAQYERTKSSINARQTHLQRKKSVQMNSQRHAKRNQALELVMSDWSKRKADFPSAEKAGRYYSDWLTKRGFDYEPRTITGWIRKYAKENNIILR